MDNKENKVQNKMVSVIIPTYNTEKYVKKCLKSVMEQTYRNIEIIVVDDGSNDYTVEYCRLYQQIDSRIKIITKDNGGAGSARNIGLKNASGDYVSFVDSDDYIEKQMIETLVRLLEEYNADISFCGVYTNPYEKSNSNELICYDNRTAFCNLLSERILSYPVNKLYKKELFDNVWFPENMTFEDLYIMPEIFSKASKVVETKADLYWYYYNRPDNISSKKNIQHAVDCAVAFVHRYEFACKILSVECELGDALKKAVSMTIGAYGLTHSLQQYQSFNITAKHFIKENLKKIILNPKLDWKRKAVATVVAYTNLYKYLYLVKK